MSSGRSLLGRPPTTSSASGCSALRGDLIDEAGYAALSGAVAELRDDADAVTPGKIAKVRDFEMRWHLGDILVRAHDLSNDAQALPGHSAARSRMQLKAVVLALVVNGCDRQGDLQGWRIGREIVRMPTGAWVPAFRQHKSGNVKDNGPLWAPVCAIIDRHVLGDRPGWAIDARVAELDGTHLFSLGPDPIGTYQPSTFLREEFDVGAHLVRTLVTDLLRRHQPDAAWAVKLILGHTTRTMQRTYQTDFREAAAVDKGQATIAHLVTAAERHTGRRIRQRRSTARQPQPQKSRRRRRPGFRIGRTEHLS